MSIKGMLVRNEWLRRPELEPLETKEHSTYKGLFFELGRDKDGKVDVRRVQYPIGWDRVRILNAIQNRESILENEGCPHCTAYDIKREKNNNNGKEKERRLRLVPGKRPLRDRLLKVWDLV